MTNQKGFKENKFVVNEKEVDILAKKDTPVWLITLLILLLIIIILTIFLLIKRLGGA